MFNILWHIIGIGLFLSGLFFSLKPLFVGQSNDQ